MVDISKDTGVFQVLAVRLITHRVPRALSLMDKVDRGETLDEFDIIFLEGVFKDTRQTTALMDRHPEWQDLATKAIQLYKEITTKALENEKTK